MKKRLLLFIILGLSANILFAQNNTIDSLLKVINSTIFSKLNDTTKVNTLKNLCKEYDNAGEFEKGIKYGNEGIQLAQKIKYKTGEVECNKYMGYIFQDQSDYPKALEYFSKSLSISEEIDYKQGMAGIYSAIGNIYADQSKFPDALKNYFEALKLCSKLNDKQSTASLYNNIGTIYQALGNNEEALKNYNSSLTIRIKINDKQGIAETYNNIGGVFYYLKNYREALKNYFSSFKIKEELGDKNGMAATYGNIGIIYKELGNYEDALKNAFNSLRLAEEIGDKRLVASSYNILGQIFLLQKDYKQALLNLNKFLSLAKELGAIDQMKEAYEYLAEIYAKTNDYKAAFENHRLFKQMNDSIFNSENNRNISNLETNFAVEKKETELKEEQEKKDIITKQELKRQKIIILFVVIGLLLVVVFSVFIFRSLRITNKQKTIIEIKSKETETQKQIVELKNKEITQSIEYALRIQTAILPSARTIKQHLENSFVLYKPKDIVAGDFYWMEIVEIKNERNGEIESDISVQQNSPDHQINNSIILFAACDCTGHGVPGAMVSVVCNNALNRAVREFGLIQPAAILDKTAEIVIENFSKSEESIKDGMDISLCAINKNAKTIHWAGANNPLWIFQNGEILETKADKQPIGMNENKKPFTNHEFSINNGDCIYLFTDGYADQFGGEQGNKKLTRKRFRDLVLSMEVKSMQEQCTALDKFITEYRGEVEQIDDILVIGIRI